MDDDQLDLTFAALADPTRRAILARLAQGRATVNVLAEPELRANLPRYSNWPTFPQLFVKGELVGGCDITLEMYKSGELQQLLAEAGAVAA